MNRVFICNMFKHVVLIFIFSVIRYSHGQCEQNRYNFNQQSETSSCLVWGDYSIKTFDDYGFNFKSACSFSLTEFEVGTSQFKIEVGKSNKPCNTNDCYTFTKIHYGNEVYKLGLDDKQIPVFSTSTRTYLVPSDLPGISIYKRGSRVFVDFVEIGISIQWNVKNIVEVTIDNSKGYKVLGLCGNNDKCSSNDQMMWNGVTTNNFEYFLQSWQTDNATCSGIEMPPPCNSGSAQKAEDACQILKDPQKFGQANEIVNPDLYIRACVASYCSCKLPNPAECICGTLDAYAKASVSAGVRRVSWRDDQTCPKRCSGDLHFQSCAPKGGVRTCGDSGPSQTEDKCEEGCYCLPGNFLFNGKCYLKKNCPCLFRGKVIQPDETVPNDCNTCTCTNGKLECTDNPCSTGTCHGDPHCTTFDGKKYDFMGKCTYYLVKGPDFSIESDHFGLQNGHFLKNYTQGPSYVRGVFVRMSGQVIELKPDLVVLVNKIPIVRFPHMAEPLMITKPSSSFVVVHLPNNIQVVWNGVWTVNVKVPRSMGGKVMGLLGTFTDDQSDDFMTPNGEIVESATAFGNSWKTEYSCPSEPDKPMRHPCDDNPDVKPMAEKACSIIKSQAFRKCMTTDPETDYANCVFDACYHRIDLAKSYCQSIAVAADECARRGVSLNWRKDVPECKIPCSGGMEYQTCSDGCSRSCEDISLRPRCAKICVEGCNCPSGYTLNENGRCIPISQCKCRIDEVVYPPGFQYLKNEEELLTCSGARWVVSVPSHNQTPPTLEELNKKCVSTKNSVYTPCRYPVPKTCQNMKNYAITVIETCEESCQCLRGYVLDTTTGNCVKPENCPCYDKGESKPDGSITSIDQCSNCVCKKGVWDCSECCDRENEMKKLGCKVCVCKNGLWKCISNNCEEVQCTRENEIQIRETGKCVCKEGMWRCVKAQCDYWGDSNIKTFDGVTYDFQGECTYKLVQGKIKDYQFTILIKNERCSYAGATCLKAVMMIVQVGGGAPESISLFKNEDLPDTKDQKMLLLTDHYCFVTVDFIGAGVRLFWNKKTWIYVQVDRQWLNSLEGLCGNYSGIKSDDLMISGKPIDPKEAYRYVSVFENQCQTGPKPASCIDERLKWAEERCSLLLSEGFAQCRSKVPVSYYYQACIADACKCEINGECQSLCTAISAYAQQCNNYGITVSWRTNNFCSLQCLGHTHYKSCMRLCPVRTCEVVQKNITQNCEEVTCVEGCAPKHLPAGYVYSSVTYEKIVVETSCVAPQCNVEGSTYYDQEIISKSPCKLRYCSAGKDVCVKLPTCPKYGYPPENTSDCNCECQCT